MAVTAALNTVIINIIIPVSTFTICITWKISSWSKRPGCYLVTRQSNFSLFPLGSNHLTFSKGRVIEWLKYPPESPSADYQAGWNSSLDRPILMHRSFQIGLCAHEPINRFLPWAPCGARLAPNCVSGPPWPLHCNSESSRRSTRKEECASWGGGLYNTSQFLQDSSSGENIFNIKHYKLLITYVYLLFLWYRFPKIICLSFFWISRDV